jgi:DNA repair exonuclease SbcCD ATPase subunit
MFKEDVKAFFCPRCRSLLTFGVPECPQCGMKFRVKAVKETDVAAEVYAPSNGEEHASNEPSSPVEPEEMTTPESEVKMGISEDELQQLRELVRSMSSLVEARADLLGRMSTRVEEEKARLAEMEGMDGANPKLDLVEAGAVALAEEMTDVTNLYSSMMSVAEEISALSGSLDIGAGTEQKGLAAKALDIKEESGGARADELKAKEEQVAKREEMVDRKIKGYAQKKKELDDKEAELSARVERIQREKALLEEMKASVEATGSESVRENERVEMEREAVRRLMRMEATLKGEQESPEPNEDMMLDDRMSSLESQIRKAAEAKEEADLKLRELVGEEDEVRKLLRALDKLLGQLPELAIQKFTQSEDYRLYERVLDRLKI